MAVNETQYHVSVSADGVETGLQRAQRAWNQYQSDVEKTNAAVSRAVEQAQQVTNDTTIRTQRSIDSFIKSLAREADTAGKPRSALLELRAAQLGVAGSAKEYIDQIKAAEAASKSAAHGAGLFNSELIVMAHEASQSSWKNLGGSFMVYAEQLHLVSLLANPVAIGLIAIAAAAGSVGLAMAEGAAQSSALNKAIQISGDAAGVTASQMDALGDSINNARGNHGGNANDVISSLIGTGKVGLEAIDAATNAVLDYAAATGQSAEEAQKAFEPLFDDPTKGAEKLNESMHFLTPAIYDHIKALQDAGDTDGALKVAMQAVDDQVKNQTTSTGYLASAWDSLTGSVKGAWRAMMDWGKESTLQDKLATAQSNLSFAKADQMTHGSTHVGGWFASDDDRAKAVADAQKAVDDAQKAVQDEAQKAAQKATDALVTQSHIDTDRLNDAHLKDTQRRAKAAEDANKEYQARIAKLNATGTYSKAADDQFAAERDAKIAEANRQGSQGSSNAAQNAISAQLAKLDAQQSQYEKDLRASLERIKTLQDGHVITAADALQQEHDARLKALQDELAVQSQEEEIAKGKKQQAAYEKYAAQVEATNKAILAENQQFVADKQKLQDADTRAIAAYTANLQGALDKQNAQSAKAAAEVGMTSTEKAAYEERLQIQEDYLKRRADLEAKYANKSIDSNVYNTETAANEKNRTDRLGAAQNGQDELKKSEGDWTKGASAAFNTYLENAQNTASQMQTVFADAFDKSTDALLNFVQTGKLNFSDLTKAVIGDLEKMGIEKALAGAMSWASNTNWSGVASSALSYLHFADGGHVQGPGSGTSDSIPAMLSNGEYVLTADTVRRLGVGNLDRLNNGAHVGSAARYASGGLVTSQVSSVTSGARASGSDVAVTVNSGSGLTADDAPWLQKAIQTIVDTRIAQKMKGQGGYAWQINNGVVG